MNTDNKLKEEIMELLLAHNISNDSIEVQAEQKPVLNDEEIEALAEKEYPDADEEYYGNEWYTFEKVGFVKGFKSALQYPKPSAGVLTEIDKARFWTKVKPTDYCWIWEANKDSCGYGMFKANGVSDKASRWAYRIIYGEFPKELHVLHKCDNPICVNPDHLFTGTHQDNMLDKIRKGRGRVLGRSSKYHGVVFRKDSNNWRAHIQNSKTHVSIGSYSTEIEAAKARDKYVIDNNLNLPLNF